MTDHLRTLSGLAKTYVSCYPNAGLPDVDGCYSETPEMLAERIVALHGRGLGERRGRLLRHDAGAHARARGGGGGEKAAADPDPLASPSCPGSRPSRSTSTTGPCIVGERTNVLGSRKFKRLIAEGKFEAAAEIARSQVKNGAQVIDVCLQDPDRDETADVERVPRARHEDGQGPAHDRLDGRARCSSSA